MKCKAMMPAGAGRAGMHTIGAPPGPDSLRVRTVAGRPAPGGGGRVTASYPQPRPSAQGPGMMQPALPVYRACQRSVNNVFRRVHNAGQTAPMGPGQARRGGN